MALPPAARPPDGHRCLRQGRLGAAWERSACGAAATPSSGSSAGVTQLSRVDGCPGAVLLPARPAGITLQPCPGAASPACTAPKPWLTSVGLLQSAADEQVVSETRATELADSTAPQIVRYSTIESSTVDAACPRGLPALSCTLEGGYSARSPQQMSQGGSESIHFVSRKGKNTAVLRIPGQRYN